MRTYKHPCWPPPVDKRNSQRIGLIEVVRRASHVAVTTAALLTIGACATPPPAAEISVPFDAESASRAIADGPNTIVGSALIRQSGGGIVHCGGQEVLLVGATDYSSELMVSVFGSTDTGYASAESPKVWSPKRNQSIPETIIHAVNVHPDWWQAARLAMCDAQGEFVFDDVADGAYFLLVSVVWYVSGDIQGGTMMSRIEISGGKTHRVVISPSPA